MNAKELLKLKPKLEGFLSRFDDCFSYTPSRKHLLTYVHGQLGPLERKSVEPIALDAGVPPRSLQEFLSIHRWREDAVAKRIREIVRLEHSSRGAIGIIDETGFPKKGKKTPGVQHQYCGQTGKTDNCIVMVDLGYVAEDFHCLVDCDLYVPESWIKDEERRREARIPEELKFRTKGQIALDLIRRTMADGVPLEWITADELYGRDKNFRNGLDSMGLLYVVEIPCSLMGWTKWLAKNEESARRVDELWPRGGPSWELYRVKDTGKGPEVWDCRVSRFITQECDAKAKECWLLVAQNVLSGEVKYFLSNAPEDIKPEVILKVAFTRWRIERIFEDGKGEVGMGHFEVRNYLSLKRHMIITMLSFLFLARSTEWLTEKKFSIRSVK